jgi:hypothetical protein
MLIFSIASPFRKTGIRQTKTPFPAGNGVCANLFFTVSAGYDPPFPCVGVVGLVFIVVVSRSAPPAGASAALAARESGEAAEELGFMEGETYIFLQGRQPAGQMPLQATEKQAN